MDSFFLLNKGWFDSGGKSTRNGKKRRRSSYRSGIGHEKHRCLFRND